MAPGFVDGYHLVVCRALLDRRLAAPVILLAPVVFAGPANFRRRRAAR
ncbi:MAG: hypothetical protein M3P53_09100 [Actinomycetota bacterium]|nr:hypothetical protein [Actinomycetota bacterium]